MLIYNENLNRWETKYSLTDPRSRWREVYDWCWQVFGHPGTDPVTGSYGGWDYHAGHLYFYDEKHVTMFMLRWS